MKLAKDGAEDAESSEEGGGDDGVATDTNIQGSCRGWLSISIRGLDDDETVGLTVAGEGEAKHLPSRASSKQWPGSQWLVKMTILWPRFWSPTAASTTSLSAPPMPKSGCRKTIVLPSFVDFFAMVEAGSRGALPLPTRWAGQ